MPNPRSDFELGQRVKYYDDFALAWREGFVEQVIPHAGSSAGDYKCNYKVKFNNGSMGHFSNCNPFLMCDTVDQTYFFRHVLDPIDFDDMFWV